MPGPLYSSRYSLIWLLASVPSLIGMQKLPSGERSAYEVSPVWTPRMSK